MCNCYRNIKGNMASKGGTTMNYEIKNAYREVIEPSPCITRKMTDEERLEQGRPRPNSDELYWILKDSKKSAEYQNTYGLSNEYMTELKQCMSQKGFEHGLGRKAAKAKEAREIPMGLLNY
jgi:predicted HTH transcriptional regulator